MFTNTDSHWSMERTREFVELIQQSVVVPQVMEEYGDDFSNVRLTDDDIRSVLTASKATLGKLSEKAFKRLCDLLPVHLALRALADAGRAECVVGPGGEVGFHAPGADQRAHLQ